MADHQYTTASDNIDVTPKEHYARHHPLPARPVSLCDARGQSLFFAV